MSIQYLPSSPKFSGILGVVLLLGVVGISRYIAHRLPCPAGPDHLHREILLESTTVASSFNSSLKLDAYIHNESRRALTRVVVEAVVFGSDRLRAEAMNNEPGAPSVSNAPILPGAWRAVRFNFDTLTSPSVVPPLRVVSCVCD